MFNCVKIKESFVDIGIPIGDINQTSVHLEPTQSSIFLKTSDDFSSWTREALGMKPTPECHGHYSSHSNCKLLLYNFIPCL